MCVNYVCVCVASPQQITLYLRNQEIIAHNSVATEPAASATVPVMAHLELVSAVPVGEGGTRPHHMVFYVAGCGAAGELSREIKDAVDWTN